jgi:hypothetical protein
VPCLEQFLPLALCAEGEVCGGTWQRKHLAQQSDIIVISHPRAEQCPQFPEPNLDRVVAGEPGGAFVIAFSGVAG